MLAQSSILAAALLLPSVSAHIALFHPSMWGYNISGNTVTSVPGDNRPVYPLMGRTFSQWWFHGHMDFPPHPNDIFQLPVGQSQVVELACDKGATSYWPISDGSSNLQLTAGDGNSPCPGQPTTQFHTNGISDLGGCALAVAYNSDPNSVKPEDFVVFSVQHTCVWTKNTYFDIPADMPPCPNGKCICSWNWIHLADAGSEQMYLNMFQCDFKGATGTKAVAKGNVPRRCGADPANGKMEAVPSNCTVGAKTPMYWYQTEGNNMFEGTYAPPLYLDLYGFAQGAQNDIFDGSASTPVATNSATAVPTTSKATAPTTSQAAATTTKAADATTSKVADATTSKAEATTSEAAAATTSKAASSAPASSVVPTTSQAAAITTAQASSSAAATTAAPVNNVGKVTSSSAPAAVTSSVFVADPSASPEVTATASATKSASAASATTSGKPSNVCKHRKHHKRPTLAELAHNKKAKVAARIAKDASVKRAVSGSSRRHHAKRAAAAAEVLL